MTRPNCPCRLCGANSVAKFRLTVLDRFEVQYFECANCGSLQTEEPYWLTEAYGQSNLGYSDAGAAQRVLINCSFVALFTRLMRLHTALDFGGGDGLLCRLLRDRGLDAYTIDTVSLPSYAQPFVGSLEKNYDLVTAFEVFEHFPNPRELIEQLFRCRPRFLLASTELYAGNGPDWWYLAPNSGQHVFFYSGAALKWIAARHCYYYYAINGRHVFAKAPVPRLRLSVLSRFTGNRFFKLYRASLPFSETWTWIQRDYETSLKKRVEE
jgi:hypothetical protein